MIAWGEWLLTAGRVAVHQPTGTAVVADLHLGYAEARRRRGDAIPAPPVEEALAPLAAVLQEHGLQSLLIAGDLFEAKPDRSLIDRLLAWLETTGVRNVTIIAGNHDRGVGPALSLSAGPIRLGAWQVVHGDGARPKGAVVQGHLHPALRFRPDLPLLPCYLAQADHLVLPAYSTDAAGVDVSRQPRFDGYHRFAIAGCEVLPLTRKR